MFKNRTEAGELLSQKLSKYTGNAVVYAIPRGGVVVGAEIAQILHVPLDLIVVRKIGHPQNPEYAIGAVSESGQTLLTDEAKSVDPVWLKNEIDRERKEAQRRRETYLPQQPTYETKDKTIIVVDDGIATGTTFLLALREARNKHGKQVVAAIPVLPSELVLTIQAECNELVYLDAPPNFAQAVGAYYEDFRQVEDSEVITLMEKYNQ